MKQAQDKFYQKSSRQFKEYKFKSTGQTVQGEKPNFFKVLKKYANKEFKVLDVGCGSGELTLELSTYFAKIIGIDPFESYIITANKKKDKQQVPNVQFIVADGKSIPFDDDEFDLVFSSRGPVSQNIDFMREACRVLKKGSLLIEETIGEEDKLELKRLFGRGQNYPFKQKKLEQIKENLHELPLELVFFKYYKYSKEFDSKEQVLELLKRAPVIPDFDETKDDKNLIATLEIDNKIVLSTHRLHWIAKKI